MSSSRSSNRSFWTGGTEAELPGAAGCGTWYGAARSNRALGLAESARENTEGVALGLYLGCPAVIPHCRAAFPPVGQLLLKKKHKGGTRKITETQDPFEKRALNFHWLKVAASARMPS